MEHIEHLGATFSTAYRFFIAQKLFLISILTLLASSFTHEFLSLYVLFSAQVKSLSIAVTVLCFEFRMRMVLMTH